jgi:hypothetical protein
MSMISARAYFTEMLFDTLTTWALRSKACPSEPGIESAIRTSSATVLALTGMKSIRAADLGDRAGVAVAAVAAVADVAGGRRGRAGGGDHGGGERPGQEGQRKREPVS